MMANARPRPGYYGRTAAPVPVERKPEPVTGAEDIAAVIGFTPDQIYRMADRARRRPDDPDAPPIRKQPGVGLVADRRALLDWYRRVYCPA
ncbi:hypothetical protein FFK22_009025 [Mycobacterium sp. KBS0706]|uniref:hypothetical protein n=1 Tax=Mycobacterium sp. KBS0706 TaxID=2578109 RepID=UPI00110FEFB0|nr:hypothetical protein [Mycobacterium sp. KBS0706]TSD89110.1 hypothetical protein FFK22_009025 [Mycobacterium sp. KBS0706]